LARKTEKKKKRICGTQARKEVVKVWAEFSWVRLGSGGILCESGRVPGSQGTG
jgi:hypothetical protein